MTTRPTTSKTRMAPLAILFAITACDRSAAVGSLPDSALPADSDPGHGTMTLLVDATISATEQLNNASTTNLFVTEFEVTITRSGTPVSDAEVHIGSAGGIVTLAPATMKGNYSASQDGYEQTYTLDIEAGTDVVKGVRLVGPELHTISSPRQGTAYPAGQMLTIIWFPTGADEVEVATLQMPPTIAQDTGEYSVDGGFIKGNPAKVSEDHVQVWRSNFLGLSGGAPLSTLTVRIRNQVEFSIDQT